VACFKTKPRHMPVRTEVNRENSQSDLCVEVWTVPSQTQATNVNNWPGTFGRVGGGGGVGKTTIYHILQRSKPVTDLTDVLAEARSYQTERAANQHTAHCGLRAVLSLFNRMWNWLKFSVDIYRPYEQRKCICFVCFKSHTSLLN
jgi:hypothetical protein